MTQALALAEAKKLQAIMRKHGVNCVIELKAGRPWSGSAWYSRKQAVMNHHTAGSKSGLTPSLNICRNGRTGLPGPLCNGYGGRDRVYRIITMGLANHPGQGGPLTLAGFTVPKDSARISVWGTEWEHDGVSPWPQAMRDFMARSNAALNEWLGIPLGRQHEHSTWAPKRKIDRNTYTAASGRAEISRYLSTAGAPVRNIAPEDDDMPTAKEIAEEIWNGPHNGKGTMGNLLRAMAASLGDVKNPATGKVVSQQTALQSTWHYAYFGYLAASDPAKITAAIVAALPKGAGNLTSGDVQTAVEKGVRNVFATLSEDVK